MLDQCWVPIDLGWNVSTEALHDHVAWKLTICNLERATLPDHIGDLPNISTHISYLNVDISTSSMPTNDRHNLPNLLTNATNDSLTTWRANPTGTYAPLEPILLAPFDTWLNDFACLVWGVDHTGQFWQHPSASPAVIVWKMVSQHLIFEHDPQQIHGWNRTRSLVWSGHESPSIFESGTPSWNWIMLCSQARLYRDILMPIIHYIKSARLLTVSVVGLWLLNAWSIEGIFLIEILVENLRPSDHTYRSA